MPGQRARWITIAPPAERPRSPKWIRDRARTGSVQGRRQSQAADHHAKAFFALTNMGYKEGEARRALEAVRRRPSHVGAEEQVDGNAGTVLARRYALRVSSPGVVFNFNSCKDTGSSFPYLRYGRELDRAASLVRRIANRTLGATKGAEERERVDGSTSQQQAKAGASVQRTDRQADTPSDTQVDFS